MISIVEGYSVAYFEGIFNIFDEEGNGALDFREFMCGVSTLVGSTLKQRIILYA